MSITLVAGLGNPGREYAATRHNVGWVVVEAWAAKLGLSWQANPRFDVETARWDRAPGETCHFVKPLTYMNESGRAIGSLTGFYKVPISAVIVVYDDLAIDLGRVKVSVRGSAGGHNGISSILEHLGDGFVRYRVGIGPKHPPEMDIKDFVLEKFTAEQSLIIASHLETYVSGLNLLLTSGVDRAMNLLNRRDKNESEQT